MMAQEALVALEGGGGVVNHLLTGWEDEESDSDEELKRAVI
jgi:hypothetical protein